MTDKNEKRKIEITDRRAREEDELTTDPLSDLQAEAAEALGAMDDVLSEFGNITTESAGQAAIVDELVAGEQAAETTQPAAEPVAEPVETQPVEAEPSVEQQLAGMTELVQRKEAELRNSRKRTEKDISDARRFAVEGLLFDLFPALDGLAQAVETFKDTPDGESPLLDGVRGTIKAVDKALLKHGIEKINEAGVPFDAELHQPLSVEASAEVAAEQVAEVYVEGYRLGDKILKPAMVKVVKPE